MNNKTPYNKKENCCGCRSCELICPVNAISMITDEEGFLYPKINSDLCIDCGKCRKACHFLKKEKPTLPKKPKSFVCTNKNLTARIRSRSGGVFVALSDYILALGGFVYGAGLTINFDAQHSKACSPLQRDKFCGSKYVQSDTLDTYELVYKDLLNSRYVLFSGTACQIGGLYHYLSSKGLHKYFFNFLITCDIVCHGVVSPKIWRDNLQYIENQYGKIQAVNFRDKDFGWNSHVETYDINNEKITSTYYTSIFYEHVALRPSCYNCPYTSIEREADITLADAWGIAKQFPNWNDNQGHSLVLINTEKGEFFYQKILNTIISQEVDLNNFMQPNLEKATLYPKNRSVFWKMYYKKGYYYVARKCEKRQRNTKKMMKIKAFFARILRKFKG